MKKYSLNAPCPCESGKSYKNCCKKKVEYLLDDDGSVVRSIPLPQEALDIIEKNRQDFINLFKREPEPNEPLFFHQLLMSEEDYMDGVEEMFKQVGISEEKFYAYKKTGIPITESNINKIPDIDIKTWKKAIKEYRDIKSGRKKVKRPDILNSIDILYEELNFNQYLLGLIIYKQNALQQVKRFDENITDAEYLLFCLTKNLKTLRAAINLIELNFGEDALNLIRSIFENYLHIAMSIRNKEFMLDIKLKIGLLMGTHQQRNKGSEKVIEIASGKEFKLKFTKNHQLASCHPIYGELDILIYRYLYDFLSSFTHPNLVAVSCYTDEEGFNYLKRNFSHESILYISFINLLIMNEIKYFEGVDATSVTDIERFTQRIAPHLIKIFEQVEKDFPNYPHFLRERIEKLLNCL